LSIALNAVAAEETCVVLFVALPRAITTPLEALSHIIRADNEKRRTFLLLALVRGLPQPNLKTIQQESAPGNFPKRNLSVIFLRSLFEIGRF
jgi:hypothetical protein